MDDELARRVAEIIAGPVTFDDFEAEVKRRGYTIEAVKKSDPPGATYHIYKVRKDLKADEGCDPPLLSIYWYVVDRGRDGRHWWDHVLEAGIRGEVGGHGAQVKVFTFSPKETVLRLDEIEERLARAWRALAEG